MSFVRDFAAKTNSLVFIPHGIGCALGGGDWEIVNNMINDIIPIATIVSKEN